LIEHFCQTDNKLQEKIAVFTGQGKGTEDLSLGFLKSGVYEWH